VLLSIAAFGWGAWEAFWTAASGSHAVYESLLIDRAGLATPFGAVLMLGGNAVTAYAVQGTCTVLVAILVANVWRNKCSLPVRAATLMAALPLAVPVFLHYDLVLDAIAAAFLIRHACDAGFMPWQRIWFVALYLAPILMGNTNMSPRFLLAPAASLTMFALAMLVARRETQLQGRTISRQIEFGLVGNES
jgi:hypothetical protein